MKTSEMMAMLEENPKLRFWCTDDLGNTHRCSVTSGGYLNYGKFNKKGMFLDPSAYLDGQLGGNINLDKFDWQIVRQFKSVTVGEAIDAWAKNRQTIKCKHESEEYVFDSFTSFSSIIAWRLIFFGIWYIEDLADE